MGGPMSDADFKSLLNIDARHRKAMETEAREADYAQLGRVVDMNIRSNKFALAIQVAILKGGTGQQIANRIASFLLTGTITS